MTEPLLRTVTCASPRGLHRIAYAEWLPPEGVEPAGTVVCVHGLTRNGRDFDALARRLSARYRVICPDMIGRGRSDRAVDSSLYMVPQYVADCVTLIARLNVESVAWVGTSMGGLIGMSLASLRGAPISRLLVNDIGPVIDPAGLQRIASYVGDAPDFATYEEGRAYTREVAEGFGPLDDAGWDLIARHYWIPDGGRWRVHYDPRIAEPFKALAGQPSIPLWGLYDAIACPTLVVRGSRSDLLDADTARQMTERGPRAKLVEIAGVGHAPTFIPDDQIAIVENFLKE